MISLEYDGMVSEARELAKISDNIVVKIPMTVEGLKAVRTLTDENIKTNVTLIFSPLQALMAAKAGATYASPFVGRLDDLAETGMGLIEEIVQIYGNYGYTTEVIVASVRNPSMCLIPRDWGRHCHNPLQRLKEACVPSHDR